MNCKPDELAVVVKAKVSENIGRVVRTVRFLGHVDGWAGTDRWEIEADRPLIGSRGTDHFHIQDSYLRPIRNPGEDARDETLDWLPVPAQEHAHV